jgi:(1->4)-alpha-D-glucan 1-alpha-D-glucosylmutase
MLEEISNKLGEGAPCCAKLAVARELLGRWADGGVKIFVTSQGLGLRKRKADSFLRGGYAPLSSQGSAAAHVAAFGRNWRTGVAVAVAPRLVASLAGFESGLLPLGTVWKDTELDLGKFAAHSLRNVFTGQTFKGGHNGRLRLEELFGEFPVALLTNGE